MKRPETRYAWNGDVSLAYQVLGHADTDLLYLQGYCSNVDMNWTAGTSRTSCAGSPAKHA
jgi:hypothetical protein